MDQKAARLTDDVDRISKLPDEILSHILSYLPTKSSVRTRILSKRWKYVFTLVPVLSFGHCYDQATKGSFLEFVDFVLNSYNVNRMDKFVYRSFSFLVESEGARLVSWIQNIVNREVRELCVSEILISSQTLPHNVFTSETLTILNLQGKFNLDIPDNVWLPNLKTLHLIDTSFLGDDSVRRLFLSCPVLEDLFLRNRRSITIIEVLEICSSSLLSLRLHGIGNELVLDVPNLRYFEYHDNQLLGISVRGELKSLVAASINFRIRLFEHRELASKLVSFFSHVQTFHLWAYMLKVFQRFNQPLLVFNNLTRLVLSCKGGLNFETGLLLDLLHRAPHLDFLRLDKAYYADAPKNASDLEHVPMCVSTHLKVIEFREFLMTKIERMLVEYFLKNAKALNILNIRLRSNLKEECEISKELQTIPRCSSACQVILYSSNERRG